MKSNTRHFTELLLIMTAKELRTRYKHTILGFLWGMVNPLIQMVVIGFVFNFFIKEPINNYYYYLLTGLLVWNFFSLSISKTTSSLLNERNLIKKAKFNSEVIPLSIILSDFVHLLFALLLLSIPMFVKGLFYFMSLPKLLAAIILLLIFTVGLSFLTSSLNVKYRDINFLVQATLLIWFYATPIVYSINVIPYNLMWFWRINPMISIIQLFQNAFVSAPAPGWAMLSINSLIIMLVFVAGVVTFRNESKKFDDWL